MNILKTTLSKKWLWLLILLYAVGVSTRFIIGLFTSQNPFIIPDEALYANIARSIADGTGISLRNQPITYTSLLYPLLIAPIYSLFTGGAQFRAIQFFNCAVMNLAVFPAWGLAKKFTSSTKTALGVAILSLLMPDMLLTTRIMTEALVYPLFFITIYLMFTAFTKTNITIKQATLTGLSAFLLYQAKAGSIALVIVFLGILVYDYFRQKQRNKLFYLLLFTGVFAALALITHIALLMTGMDFAQKTIYQLQTQAPTLEHLKKTLPGLLLYAFFIPIAFGIYPLLLPAANIKRFDSPQRRLVLLALLALVLYAAGACYMFFDSETIGNYFQGRIHIRYVFMFLPLFACFAASPALNGARINAKLIACLGFLFAMTSTVSFSALLSGRQFPVDAILLSYIIFDDATLNWRLLSQIAVITFAVVMLALLYRKGWAKQAKLLCAGGLVLALVISNLLGYNLNSYNNTKALSSDAAQASELAGNSPTLLSPDSGIYFDNTLSVLDTAMTRAPYVLKYDDLCASLGAYGCLIPQKPPKYWTENPVNTIPLVRSVIFNATAFNKMVLADGTKVTLTKNGYYVIVTPAAKGRLLHSAIVNLPASGIPGKDTALYLYDEKLLSQKIVHLYLKVKCTNPAQIAISCGESQSMISLDENSRWVFADVYIPEGSTALKISITTQSGAPMIETYRVE